MSSDALTVPWWRDPATRSKSSQFRRISLVGTRERAMLFKTPVIGAGIEAPELRFPNISQAWTKLVAQQPKQAKHHITDTGRICHDLHRPQLCLVFQEAIEDIHGITQGPRDDNGMEAGELVRREVVIRHATIRIEILAVGTGIDRADRDHEPQPIRRGDFTPALLLRQRHGGLRVDEAGVGSGQGVCTDIVLLHPTEPAAY
jgi:hypothetical protein